MENKKGICYPNQKGRASARTSGHMPASGAAPTPVTASHRTSPRSHQILHQQTRLAARGRSRARDRVQPSRLDPHPGCAPGVKPAAHLPPPRRAPPPPWRHPRPFSRPNVSSHLQHSSDRCSICSILLEHTCMVIATSR